MRVKPTNLFKPAREKIKYKVTIEENVYSTSAFNEEGAKSNAAYRYGQDEDMDVGLVLRKIKIVRRYDPVSRMYIYVYPEDDDCDNHEPDEED